MNVSHSGLPFLPLRCLDVTFRKIKYKSRHYLVGSSPLYLYALRGALFSKTPGGLLESFELHSMIVTARLMESYDPPPTCVPYMARRYSMQLTTKRLLQCFHAQGSGKSHNEFRSKTLCSITYQQHIFDEHILSCLIPLHMAVFSMHSTLSFVRNQLSLS